MNIPLALSILVPVIASFAVSGDEQPMGSVRLNRQDQPESVGNLTVASNFEGASVADVTIDQACVPSASCPAAILNAAGRAGGTFALTG